MIAGGANGDGAKQRTVLGALGIVAALVLLVASMIMNYRFGYSLATSPEDGLIYGAVSAAADAFKALCPFFFFAAWRDRQWAGALASAAVWLVVVLYASAGAAGHAGTNRLNTAGERTLAADHYKDLRADKERYEKQLKWLPATRDPGTVQAEIESARAKNLLLWNHSSECDAPEGKAQREFCAQYKKLGSELSSAKSAVDLNAKIDGVSAKLSGAKGGAAVSDADPQATIISRMLVYVGINMALADTQTWLAIAVALVLEIGSTFGLYISVQYFRGTSHSDIIDADYKEVRSSSVGQPHVQAQTDVLVAVPLITQSKAAPDVDAVPSVPPPATVLRDKLPGTDTALAAIGIPFDGDRSGPLLEALSGKEAAEALVAWIRAHDLARADLSSDQISAYDAECCKERHRKPTYERDLKNAMERLRGVEKRRPEQPDGSRPYRYDIKPGKYPKPEPQPTPEPAQAKQEGGKVFAFGRRPLAVAPERAHMGSRRTYPGNVYRNRQLLLTSRRAA